MKINKAQWACEGDNIHLTMPLSKVDEENRLVSGWASLDNADSQGDVILKEANHKAFSRFRGNIREMHQPIAVGKMVDFKEDSYYDQETQKFYNGIYVTVHVSKGAQDTWEKVLDGTLQGFSIGGAIIEAESQWVKEANATLRFVRDYELVELSLVDSPANKLANVFSITKADDGSRVIKGMIADVRSENVFWCETDGVAKTSSNDTDSCGNCGTEMKNIGWFEYENDSVKAEKVKAIVDNFGGSVEEDPEGGVIVEKENVEITKSEEVDETSTEETVEEVANEEVQVEELDISKMFGDLEAAIKSGLEKNSQEATDAIQKATEAFENKVNELVEKHNELTNKFQSLTDNIGSVEKRLDSVESETAVKKSGDLGGSTEETLQKSKGSKWGGRFLGLSDLQ